MFETYSVECWIPIFLCGATLFLGGTNQFGAKHITEDLVHDVVLWCTLVCHNVAGSVGSNFSELHAKWLHAHPTQLRMTRHRVGCDDTQKRWVWLHYLYFWGLGWAESPKTIDYHHLDMSRDDGMDEHGSDWIYACHLVDFLLEDCQITANFPHNPTTNLDRPYSLAVEFEPVQ